LDFTSPPTAPDRTGHALDHSVIDQAIETIIVNGRLARPVKTHVFGPTRRRLYLIISVLHGVNDRAAVAGWASYLRLNRPYVDFTGRGADGYAWPTTYQASGYLAAESGCLHGAWLEVWCPLQPASDVIDVWGGASPGQAQAPADSGTVQTP